MNAQEVFDTVVNHLRKQGQRAQTDGIGADNDDSGRCRYRLVQDDGTVLMCAAGCLIHEDEYSNDMDEEGNSDTSFPAILIHYAPQSLKDRLAPHAALITELQGIHDTASVDGWENDFEDLARAYNIRYTAP